MTRNAVFATTLAAVLWAGSAGAADQGLFLRGYGEGWLMPPHNEMDLNLRRPDLQAETAGFGDNYARYALRGEVFAGYRFGGRIVKEAYIFVKPDFVFGRTIPQTEYTWSPRFIGYTRSYGAGLTLWGDWKIYTEHHKWYFTDKLAVTGDGPYGMYNSITIRKEFRVGAQPAP